ncbi:hypothetical protein [Jidongwangia harbinensis]|uniref:hypothetical protein n=1 Tax=Jidongwangia harbinensis TaxID=2878561 RepID=UPI001CD9C075|nr:hypothetical protein [Jidongwangia harbinensis]MCA2216317.1 hypothetical protein [Jidongwangia harbinensis]MCA2217052.1 hypothetical protein [Jidongwangia harbinensis]
MITGSAALFGVSLGALVTAQVQKRQWALGRQVDACAAIVVESTRLQLAIRRHWKHQVDVDWGAWNDALAEISLVADGAVVDAAGEVDAVFWQQTERIERGQVIEEADWFAVTAVMEEVRLDFVNSAKRHVIGSTRRLAQLPVRRPAGYMPGTVQGPASLDPPVDP